MSPSPAVFLDRDGTLIEEVDYLTRVSEVRLIEGAAEALVRLREAGFRCVLVTNQSGVARGYLDEGRLAEVHAHLERILDERGAHLDAIEYCPHHPTEGEPPYRARCACRKPLPGMLERAIERLDLDPARSFTVGDSLRDLDAGAALGIRGILVSTGKGEAQAAAARMTGREPHVVADVAAAVEVILAQAAKDSCGGA